MHVNTLHLCVTLEVENLVGYLFSVCPTCRHEGMLAFVDGVHFKKGVEPSPLQNNQHL